MNSKLINELAEFSDFHVGNEHYNKSHKEQQRIFMEFFAELIVRECIGSGNNLINHYINNHSEQEQAPLLAAIADYSYEIKKRFGVE